jgi:hypothetical protein
MTPTSQPRDSCSSTWSLSTTLKIRSEDDDSGEKEGGSSRVSFLSVNGISMSCLRFEAVVTRCFVPEMAEGCRIGRVRCGDGMVLVLSAEPCCDEDHKFFVFVIFSSRLGGYSQFGKVLMSALVLVLDLTGFFRRILFRLG